MLSRGCVSVLIGDEDVDEGVDEGVDDDVDEDVDDDVDDDIDDDIDDVDEIRKQRRYGWILPSAADIIQTTVPVKRTE